MKKLPSSPFALIWTAWQYFRKHPVFVPLWLWVLTVPWAAALTLAEVADDPARMSLEWTLSVLGLMLIALLIMLWGSAGVLLVAKRMIDQNKAGRARTSVKAVLGDAAPLFFPLLFTELLRECFTAYRALLFVIPVVVLALVYGGGLPAQMQTIEETVRGALVTPALVLLLPLLLPAALYSIRTSFYSIALVSEGMAYRAGLRRSRELTKGRFWHVLWTLIALVVLIVLPAEVVSYGLTMAIGDAPLYLRAIAIFLAIAVEQFGLLIFGLALVAYYGWLRKAHFADAARKVSK